MTPGRTTLIGVVLFALGVGLFAALRPPDLPPLRVGATAPPIRLPMLLDVDGAPRSEGSYGLEAYSGKVVFVNFWATWCTPCRDESPSLDRLYRAFHDRGFEVLAVSIDKPDAVGSVSSFRKELGLSFPIMLDPGRTAYAAYQATGVPETFLIDRRGRIVERVVGPRDWDQPRYASLVERLLRADPDGSSARES